MWTWGNTDNLCWKDHMANEYVLDQVNEKRKLFMKEKIHDIDYIYLKNDFKFRDNSKRQ